MTIESAGRAGSLLRRSWPRPGASTLVEAVAVIVALAVLLLQLLSYPTTEDPDPDGYVSYAQYLLAHGTLPPAHHRLPGYPAFIVAATLLVPGPLNDAVYWTQLWLTMLFCLAVWAWVRWTFGALTALLLLGIFAAPSYFSRMAVIMLPDVPYSMLMLPFLLGVGWWTVTAAPVGGWRWLPLFGLAIFALQATRPTTFGIVLLYLPALVVGLLVQRRFGKLGSTNRLAQPLWSLKRVGALLAVAILVLVANDRFLDTGAREFNAELIGYRIVTALPAASESRAEQRIDEAKRRFRRIEGEAIEDARFGTYQKFDLYEEMRPGDVQEVWRARLFAHPMRYIRVVVEEIRLSHYMLARSFVPYFLNMGRFSFFSERYPRNDGGPEGNLFRENGLVVLGRPTLPAHFAFEVDVATAVLQIVAVWGLLGLGIWRLWKPYGAITLALVLLFVTFVVAVATTNTLDARYLLPFVVPIHLAQAVALTWIARTLSGQLVRAD